MLGLPIIVLNLVKINDNSSSELHLSSTFNKYFTNEKEDIRYVAFDFLSLYNQSMEMLISETKKMARQILKELGIFFYESYIPKINQENVFVSKTKSFQKGVVRFLYLNLNIICFKFFKRMNCVDCLDRTNNCMGCFGSTIFLKQLELFGFNCEPLQEEYGVKNELLAILFEVYGVNGDSIAKQYAGSEAFHKSTLIETENGNWKTQKQNYTFLALKRYISNTLLDNEKQKCISLFLGDFLPNLKHYKHLWDLDLKELSEKINLNLRDPFSNYHEKFNWWNGNKSIDFKSANLGGHYKSNVENLEKNISESHVFKIHLKLNTNEMFQRDLQNNNNHENSSEKKEDFPSIISIHKKIDNINKISLEEEIFTRINSKYKEYLILEKNIVFFFFLFF